MEKKKHWTNDRIQIIDSNYVDQNDIYVYDVPLKKQRNFWQKYGSIVGSSLIDSLSGVWTDEERIIPKDPTIFLF